ncbi:MAG TPA: alpha/beta hydrolase [Pseudonocardiaceae bacterium]|nr:alpha/beta hydrolase [Pseudonocardiaceae bacterium]
MYRGYDQAELNRQYSPSSLVDDIGLYLAEYTSRSAEARRLLPAHLDLPYGPQPWQRFDYFPALRPNAPLHVFVHGGFWQQLDKSDSSYPALAFVPAGVAFAALGYGLAPTHSLDTIVADVRMGLRHLATTLADLPGTPSAIHLSGHSAGAHLVAMTLLADDAADLFASATLLSGVYDLAPVQHTYVNDAVRMDADSARRNSPLLTLPRRLPKLVVAVGEHETQEFGRQHVEFVAAARERGGQVEDLVVAGRNHFDLPLDLGVAGTPLSGR